MEHVSTLCAASTLGIAATGFALGQAESTAKQSRLRRKSLTLNLRDHLSANVRDFSLSTPSSPRPPQTAQADFPSISTTIARSTGAPRSRDGNGNISEGIDPPRGFTTSDSRFRRPRGQTYAGPPPLITEEKLVSFQPHRPSSTWLRRFSTASLQADSRFSAPNSLPPTFSESTNAASGQRRPASKLVKRPPSQHQDVHQLFSFATTDIPSAFRRPATSYQKSETRRHKHTQSLPLEPNFATNITLESVKVHNLENSYQWRPLFGSIRPDGFPERLIRRLSTAARPKEQSLRRITPNPDAVPALLLATSVAINRPQTKTGSDPSNTSVLFHDPFSSNSTAPGNPSMEKNNRAEELNRSLYAMELGSPAPSSVTIDVDKLEAQNSRLVEESASPPHTEDHSKPEGATLVSSLRHEKRTITGLSASQLSQITSTMLLPTATSPDNNGGHRRVISFPVSRDVKFDMGGHRVTVKRPSTSDAVVPSTLRGTFNNSSYLDASFYPYRRLRRRSIAASEPASTVISSDDTRIFTSGEEDETDFQSETAFDSIRTHLTTNSNFITYESHIESIFNKDLRECPTDDTLPRLGSFVSYGTTPREQRDGSLYLHSDYEDPYSPLADRRLKLDGQPGRETIPLLCRRLDDDIQTLMESPEENNQQLPQPLQSTMLVTDAYNSARLSSSFTTGALSADNSGTQPAHSDDPYCNSRPFKPYPRKNIFDWSEQSRSGAENLGDEERPRTVHGRHANEARGSRVLGRKSSGNLHLRSQSVPTPRDPGPASGKRQVQSKFGPWGLGSKGASEDWDGDFDFDDAEADTDEAATGRNMKAGDGLPRQGMIVPQAIMERQDRLHGQFGLVQELTLLVEELKRLRHQATALGIIHVCSTELWKEAEDIINLATIDEGDDRSPSRLPSSLALGFEDAEGETPDMNNNSKADDSQLWEGPLLEQVDSNSMAPSLSRNRGSSPEAESALDITCEYVCQNSTMNRNHIAHGRKLPFDTQSLHRLVFRARAVTRSLKDTVRSADNVSTTARETSLPLNPPFSRIFDRPSHCSPRNFGTPCIG